LVFIQDYAALFVVHITYQLSVAASNATRKLNENRLEI